MSCTRLLNTSLFALVAVGCTAEQGLPAATSACDELVCELDGKTDGFEIGEVVLDEEVIWNYSLDHGAEERDGVGRIVVRFFHGELPLATGGTILPDTESALQPAVVTLALPSLDDASETESLEFLALLQTWDDGESYSIDAVDGQGAWLSTSLPDVIERFNAVYDFTSQRGTHAARVDAEFAFSAIRFARQGNDLGVERIAMTFAEPFGDTTRFDRISTGQVGQDASADAQRAAEEMFFREEPVIMERVISMESTYSLIPGSIRALDVGNLREAAQLAADLSLETRTTVAVFEEEGLFALGELRFTRSGNRIPAVVAAFYEPSTRFRRMHADGPILLVDHSTPHFLLGLCGLGDELTEMGLASMR